MSNAPAEKSAGAFLRKPLCSIFLICTFLGKLVENQRIF